MLHAPHLLDSLLVVDVAGGPQEPAQNDAHLSALRSPSLCIITGFRVTTGSACGFHKCHRPVPETSGERAEQGNWGRNVSAVGHSRAQSPEQQRRGSALFGERIRVLPHVLYALGRIDRPLLQLPSPTASHGQGRVLT